jgi:hypothetical protein
MDMRESERLTKMYFPSNWSALFKGKPTTIANSTATLKGSQTNWGWAETKKRRTSEHWVETRWQ